MSKRVLADKEQETWRMVQGPGWLCFSSYYYNFDNQSLITDLSRMMNLIQITVESHAGNKADEYPKCFYLDNRRYEIIEITDSWYQGYSDPGVPASDYFKVKTESGDQYLLKHDLERDGWYLCG